MIVGFDFDRVLFKTNEFKDLLDEEVPGFLENYPDEGNYDPKVHAENIGVDVEEIFEVLKRSSDFLYRDIDRLEDLRENHRLIIVTRGDPYFQERKIVDSGILEHVDGYFIVQDEDKDEINIDFLVDDREKELEDVNVPGFLMNRGEDDLSDVIEAVREASS